MGRKLSALITTGCILFGSLGTCIERAREVLLPPGATPGTCFQLDTGDSLFEIPCSVFDD